MKEEEIEKLSEEYAEKNKPSDALCSMGEIIGNAREYDGLKQGFIAGSKWGMEHAIEWHKAEDLPPMETKYYTINVLTDTQEIAYFDIQTNEWVRDSSSTIIDTPSYWCKIPKYKE